MRNICFNINYIGWDLWMVRPSHYKWESLFTRKKTRSRAIAGGPRDAAVHFDTYRILQRHRPFKVISKVIDFGANRKRVCDFLCLILHRFGDFAAFMCCVPHPYSTLILGVFPLHQIAHVGGSLSRAVKLFKLFSKYSNLCGKYTSTSRTDGQTDDIQSHNCTLRSIAR